MEPIGAHWSLLEPYGAIWNLMEPYMEPYMESYGTLSTPPTSLGVINLYAFLFHPLYNCGTM